MKIRFIITLILPVLFIACSHKRVEKPDFADFDLNNDSVIGQNEFTEQFTLHVYSGWSDNNSQVLDKDNYTAREYALWDTDDDKLLSADEWETGFKGANGNYVISRYDLIDLNGDGYIDYTEYDDALSQTSYYGDMDANNDSVLDENELSSAVFKKWDTDSDGQLQRNEFNRFRKYYFND